MHMQLYTSPEDRARIRANEQARVAYQRRRHAELEAAGVSLQDAIQTIDNEIRAGAALQAEPVRITVVGAAPHDD
ncbi:MAG: hypothetical protein DI587_18500 [Variovorax paradoxus]|nr:MAG: hypothetical protein DI583_18500 [Variovorax paradoxus]PZQ08457.1 MAG: hypothetical protein DI587_18500 [Variovorax paradoxus]